MPVFDSGGVSINFIDEGGGPPVVLVHGFASSLQGNWRGPGVVDALLDAAVVSSLSIVEGMGAAINRMTLLPTRARRWPTMWSR